LPLGMKLGPRGGPSYPHAGFDFTAHSSAGRDHIDHKTTPPGQHSIYIEPFRRNKGLTTFPLCQFYDHDFYPFLPLSCAKKLAVFLKTNFVIIVCSYIVKIYHFSSNFCETILKIITSVPEFKVCLREVLPASITQHLFAIFCNVSLTKKPEGHFPLLSKLLLCTL
jgi:hypothetical protein